MYMTHPVFPTPTIQKIADFYIKKLNFNSVEYLNVKKAHICLYKNNIEIILTDSNGRKVIPNRKLYRYSYDLYVIVDNQEKLQKEFKKINLKL